MGGASLDLERRSLLLSWSALDLKHQRMNGRSHEPTLRTILVNEGDETTRVNEL